MRLTWILIHRKSFYPLEKPIKATGHLQILYGNLAEKGSVAKITGKEGERFEGPARVFDGEFELIDGINSGKIKCRRCGGDHAMWGRKVRRACPKC